MATACHKSSAHPLTPCLPIAHWRAQPNHITSRNEASRSLLSIVVLLSHLPRPNNCEASSLGNLTGEYDDPPLSSAEMGNDDRRHQYREYGRRKLQKNMKRWKWRIQKMLVWMILELAI